VDLGAIRANVLTLDRLFKAQGSSTEEGSIYAVVKSDAYGHGAVAVAQALTDMDEVCGFAVATAEEAFELRENGIKKPLLVMGHVFPYAYERMINEEIAVLLFGDDILEALHDLGVRLGKVALAHVEVDTGMSRLGIGADEQGLLFMRKASGFSHIRIEGIFTHFAQADEVDQEFTRRQYREFVAFADRVESELQMKIRYRHAGNSAAVLAGVEMLLSFTRPGIGIYGIVPSAAVQERMEAKLEPALSFVSQIVMLKDSRSGTPISYGSTFVTEKETLVATVPIGYGDGYPRCNNGGEVLVRGKRVPIIGRICMDFMMLDVTGIEDVAVGDRVTLLGEDKGERITIEDWSRQSGRYHYELICDLNQRIPRLFGIGGGL
jgi:alanine racemase